MNNIKELKFVKVNGEFEQIITDVNQVHLNKVLITKAVIKEMKKRGF